jgi:citronellyl-CoA dehydrogenase
MKLTTEHEQIRSTLKKFIDTEINPYVDEWEEAEIFPAHQVFKGLGDLGLLGVTKPEQYGGMGLDWSYGAVVAETLGHIKCGGVPMAIGVQTDMATPALARFGSEAAKEDFLRPSISGDYVACLGVSEVGSGSDVASIKTTAKKDGDDYVINGGKMWTTSGTQADWMCLLANTGEGRVHENKSLICLPLKDDNGKHRKGITIARKLKKLAMLASMAKLKVGRLAREVNDSCLQYWGGMGFMEETPVARAYRDGRLASIGGGADEVMLSIICKYLGTLPGKSNKV